MNNKKSSTAVTIIMIMIIIISSHKIDKNVNIVNIVHQKHFSFFFVSFQMREFVERKLNEKDRITFYFFGLLQKPWQ